MKEKNGKLEGRKEDDDVEEKKKKKAKIRKEIIFVISMFTFFRISSSQKWLLPEDLNIKGV
jgi:hypothetical protein